MLKIRLQRVGRKNDPSFRVIVTDHKSGPKSGNYVEVPKQLEVWVPERIAKKTGGANVLLELETKLKKQHETTAIPTLKSPDKKLMPYDFKKECKKEKKDWDFGWTIEERWQEYNNNPNDDMSVWGLVSHPDISLEEIQNLYNLHKNNSAFIYQILDGLHYKCNKDIEFFESILVDAADNTTFHVKIWSAIAKRTSTKKLVDLFIENAYSFEEIPYQRGVGMFKILFSRPDLTENMQNRLLKKLNNLSKGKAFEALTELHGEDKANELIRAHVTPDIIWMR